MFPIVQISVLLVLLLLPQRVRPISATTPRWLAVFDSLLIAPEITFIQQSPRLGMPGPSPAGEIEEQATD